MSFLISIIKRLKIYAKSFLTTQPGAVVMDDDIKYTNISWA